MKSKLEYEYQQRQTSSEEQSYCFQEQVDKNGKLSYCVQESQKSSCTSDEQQSQEEEYKGESSQGTESYSGQVPEGRKMNQTERYVYERTETKKAIARALCKKIKICPRAIRQELQDSNIKIQLTKDRYKTCAESVCSQIIRGIEKYLRVQCKMQFMPLRRARVEPMIRNVLHFREHLDKSTCLTLKNWIKYLYQLEDVELQRNLMIDLYRQLIEVTLQTICQKGKEQLLEKIKPKPEKRTSFKINFRNLQRRIKRKQKVITLAQLKPKQEYSKYLVVKPNQKSFVPYKAKFRIRLKKINQLWAEKHDKLLVNSYKQSQNFCDIQLRFSEAFPDQQILWSNTDGLRCRFERIMRKALNRFRYIINFEVVNKKSKLPELILMDERMIKSFVRKIHPAELRLKLITVCQGNQELKILQWLIIHINAEMRNFSKFRYSIDCYEKKIR